MQRWASDANNKDLRISKRDVVATGWWGGWRTTIFFCSYISCGSIIHPHPFTPPPPFSLSLSHCRVPAIWCWTSREKKSEVDTIPVGCQLFGSGSCSQETVSMTVSKIVHWCKTLTSGKTCLTRLALSQWALRAT